MTSVDRHHRMVSTTTRPPQIMAAIVVLWFLGLTAVAGGVGFFTDVGMRDPAWIEEIPLVVNWAVPGLVLGIGFGVGSLVTAYGLTRRPNWPWLGWIEELTGRHWAWFATLALGVGMLTWIGLQLVWIDFNALHAIYGTVGLSLAVLALTPSFREYLPSVERPSISDH
jgi:hypothetical protein